MSARGATREGVAVTAALDGRGCGFESFTQMTEGRLRDVRLPLLGGWRRAVAAGLDVGPSGAT